MNAIVYVAIGVFTFLVFLHSKINLIRYTRLHFAKPKSIARFKYHVVAKAPVKTVISLTTIPSRIGTLYNVIFSLLDQTMRVDQIIVNVPFVSTKGTPYKVPKWMQDLSDSCSWFHVNRCSEDLGPITKLVPTLALLEDEEALIVVVDDDTMYRRNLVESLVMTSLRFPNTAITSTGYRMFNRDKRPRKYNEILTDLRHVDILMGVNGYIVNTKFFDLKQFDIFRKSHKLFQSVDDDCISLYLLQQGIPIYAMNRMRGLSLLRFDHLSKWILNLNSDALSRTTNKSIGPTKLFGHNEAKVLADHGYYLTEQSFIGFLFY
jgi:hypothetical protein